MLRLRRILLHTLSKLGFLCQEICNLAHLSDAGGKLVSVPIRRMNLNMYSALRETTNKD